jgi:hypothetical protein
MTEPPASPAVLFARAMGRFRDEMEANDRTSAAIAAKTKRIIVWMGGLVALLALAIVIQIVSMRSDLMGMLEILQEMFVRFETMSTDMSAITGQVTSIQGRVSDFPSVAGDMVAISRDVTEMRRSVGGITGDLSTMSEAMTLMRGTTGEMTHHFHVTQQTVGHLNYNVEQMLRPMSMMPR